ncbi:MAG: hypothetical protein RSF83_10845 [Hungatella sp.]
MKDQSVYEFDKKIHFWGRLTIMVALLAFIAVPYGLAIVYHIDMKWGKVFACAAPIFLLFTIESIAGTLSNAPIIGAGAMYISTVTGNINNMKIPASINAMEVTECTPGSEKGDVVSIIAVCVSTFTTTLIILLGMLFLAPIFEPIYNNAFLKPGFTNLIPALFGALLVPYILRNKKESIVPIILPILIFLIMGPKMYGKAQSILMIVVIIISVAYSYVLHKDKFKKAVDQEVVEAKN